MKSSDGSGHNLAQEIAQEMYSIARQTIARMSDLPLKSLWSLEPLARFNGTIESCSSKPINRFSEHN